MNPTAQSPWHLYARYGYAAAAAAAVKQCLLGLMRPLRCNFFTVGFEEEEEEKKASNKVVRPNANPVVR